MGWNPGWDSIFQNYEWGKYPPEDLVRFVARNFYQSANRADTRLLEVGCGTGANLWYMAREGFSVYGIDGSKVAIERATERCESEGQRVTLQVGEIMALPYENEFFHGVVDIECIYANSLRDSKVILQEIKRVLKPGGKFFSKTFMTGTYGDGNGTALEGEPNTYLEITEGAFKKGYGTIRLTSEEDLKALYAIFEIENVDYVIRSEQNRRFEIREWLIACRKP